MTKFIAKVFVLPGFPVMIKGILFIMHVKITKMFSFNGVFFPIPFGISIFISNLEYSYSRMLIKSSELILKLVRFVNSSTSLIYWVLSDFLAILNI